MNSILDVIVTENDKSIAERFKEFQIEFNKLSKEEQERMVVEKQVKNYNDIVSEDEFNFFCDKCKNKGNVMVIYFDEFTKKYNSAITPCDCRPKREIYFNFKNSGFLVNEKKYTFSNFTTTDDFSKSVFNKAINNYKVNDWFFIGGQVGSGKTHICTAISIEILKSGRKLKMISWRDLMSDIKDGFSGKSTRFDFDKLKRVDVLFIDDFLHGKATEFELEKAFEIIDFRYRNELKTIISSELLLGEISNLMQSTGSRIVEKAKGFICDITRDSTKNYRLRK